MSEMKPKSRKKWKAGTLYFWFLLIALFSAGIILVAWSWRFGIDARAVGLFGVLFISLYIHIYLWFQRRLVQDLEETKDPAQ